MKTHVNTISNSSIYLASEMTPATLNRETPRRSGLPRQLRKVVHTKKDGRRNFWAHMPLQAAEWRDNSAITQHAPHGTTRCPSLDMQGNMHTPLHISPIYSYALRAMHANQELSAVPAATCKPTTNQGHLPGRPVSTWGSARLVWSPEWLRQTSAKVSSKANHP
jgi:hypothetical protein